MAAPDRVITSRKSMKLTRRLTKWAGFAMDFAGNLSSPTWCGYKMRGAGWEVMTVHLWRKPQC